MATMTPAPPSRPSPTQSSIIPRLADDNVSLDRTELIDTLVAAWRIKLGLLGWDIRYDPKRKPGKGYTAQTTWREAEMVAVVRIHPKLPTKAIEGTVVHELLHLALKPYTEPAQNVVASSAEPLRGFAAGLLNAAEEIVIERIVRSYGFEAFTPYHTLLPDWQVFCE